VLVNLIELIMSIGLMPKSNEIRVINAISSEFVNSGASDTRIDGDCLTVSQLILLNSGEGVAITGTPRAGPSQHGLTQSSAR